LATTVGEADTADGAAGYAGAAGNNVLAGQLLTSAYKTEQTLNTLCFQMD
jgi:hypothetical protein